MGVVSGFIFIIINLGLGHPYSINGGFRGIKVEYRGGHEGIIWTKMSYIDHYRLFFILILGNCNFCIIFVCGLRVV